MANLAARVLHVALIPSAINPNEVRYAAPELSEAIPCRGTEILVQGNTATVALPAHRRTPTAKWATHEP